METHMSCSACRVMLIMELVKLALLHKLRDTGGFPTKAKKRVAVILTNLMML